MLRMRPGRPLRSALRKVIWNDWDCPQTTAVNRLTLARRLPGFRFDTQADVPADILPRMDIAAFVGFAGAGPLDLPVPVESTAQGSATSTATAANASTREDDPWRSASTQSAIAASMTTVRCAGTANPVINA